jgi:hypothetical protein
MAFHTPQATAMKDRQQQYQMYLQQQQQQQQQPFSLLFSPPPGGSPTVKKTSDKPKQSPVHNIPNIFEVTPGSTPRSRRRSMTPASSMAKDTPPPPPGQGLLDSPGFPGPSRFGAMYGATPHGATKGQDGYGAEDMAVSPAEVPQSQAFPAILQEPSGYVTADLSLQTLADHEPTRWVTVFGFNQSDAALVIGEFSKCGEIVDFGTFNDGPGVNWMHIKYSVRFKVKIDSFSLHLTWGNNNSSESSNPQMERFQWHIPVDSCRTNTTPSVRCFAMEISYQPRAWWV